MHVAKINIQNAISYAINCNALTLPIEIWSLIKVDFAHTDTHTHIHILVNKYAQTHTLSCSQTVSNRSQGSTECQTVTCRVAHSYSNPRTHTHTRTHWYPVTANGNNLPTSCSLELGRLFVPPTRASQPVWHYLCFSSTSTSTTLAPGIIKLASVTRPVSTCQNR